MSEATDALSKACDEAYAAYPTSCSHSVWYVITKLVDSTMAHQQANPMIDMLAKSWTEVDLATAAKLANEGQVVVGGQKATGHGHVVIVYPGAAKPRGGYPATNKEGKTFTVASKGLYPLAMSTSIGTWPGAMSKGDKTVWDPWGTDASFAKVKFWHKDPGNAKTTTAKAAGVRKVFKAHNGDTPPTNPILRYFC